MMGYGKTNQDFDPAEIKRKLAKMRDVDVLARLLWGECRGELLEGQVAVACVVLNRVRDGRWGNELKGVCLRPRQFSCFDDDDPNLPLLIQPPKFAPFEAVEMIAQLAIDGLLVDPVAGATHYFNPSVVPGGWPKSWNKDRMTNCGRIGRHVFLREELD